MTTTSLPFRYVLPARTERSVVDGSMCEPYAISPRTYCNPVLGNAFVFRGQKDLERLEKNLLRFEMIKDAIPMLVASVRDKRLMSRHNTYQRCLEMADDLYCHHYFQRCFMSSDPQPVCREACLLFKTEVCVHQVKILVEFNLKRHLYPQFNYGWDIIDCTTLPFQNESWNCYYPDKVRG